MSPLEQRYRRLLRWYPRQWRARNGEAVIGALLDHAEDEQRMTPTFDDRASLIAGGLHERFLRVERPSAATVAGFGAAAAFALWYSVIIDGSPSGLIVALTVFTLTALAAAIARRPQLARLIALLGVALAVALFAVNVGPGASGTALFAGFGALAALRLRRWRDLLLALGVVAAGALSVTAGQVAVMTYPLFFIPQFWIAAVIAVASGAVAVVVAASVLVRREVSAASSPAR